jgi:hypothetical protein
MEVVEEKNSIIKNADKMKECCLKYLQDKTHENEYHLLQSLDSYNKRYHPKMTDVNATVELMNNRRLI